jgi:hypothetical protein
MWKQGRVCLVGAGRVAWAQATRLLKRLKHSLWRKAVRRSRWSWNREEG